MAVLGCPGFPWGRELSATGWQMLFPCWGGLRMEMVYRGTEQASWFSPCVYPFISNGPSSFWGRTTTEYLAGAASHGNQSTMDTSPSGAGSSENWSTVDFSADCYAAGPRSLCKVGATADNQHPTGPLPRELVYCGHMSGWGLSLREPVYCGQWGWQDSGWVSLTFQGGATSKGQRAAGASSHDWLILYLRIPEKHGLSSWSPRSTKDMSLAGYRFLGNRTTADSWAGMFLAGSHSPSRGGATMKGQHLAGACSYGNQSIAT